MNKENQNEKEQKAWEEPISNLQNKREEKGVLGVLVYQGIVEAICPSDSTRIFLGGREVSMYSDDLLRSPSDSATIKSRRSYMSVAAALDGVGTILNDGGEGIYSVCCGWGCVG